MTTADRAELIETYAAGPAAVIDALTGITPAELDHRPAADEWTVREILQHLADAEMIIGSRFRYLLAADNPQLVGFDQNSWVSRFAGPNHPIEPDITQFTTVRATTTEMLRSLSDDDWSRYGTHSELGQITVEAWLSRVAGHCHGHADQIRANRTSAAGA